MKRGRQNDFDSPDGSAERAADHCDLSRRRQKKVCAAIGCAKFFSRSHDAVIRAYDDAGNVIETHEHGGDFKEW
jgi:hypothetical protein